MLGDAGGVGVWGRRGRCGCLCRAAIHRGGGARHSGLVRARLEWKRLKACRAMHGTCMLYPACRVMRAQSCMCASTTQPSSSVMHWPGVRTEGFGDDWLLLVWKCGCCWSGGSLRCLCVRVGC
eukprot:364349-Chlamydomonas_euryale.AAC.10